MVVLHRLLQFFGWLFGRNRLTILIYHQVFAERDRLRPSEPTAAEFAWQMRLIKRFYRPMPLTEAVSALQNNTLPANAVCITFDDGYKNNLTVAAPI